MALKGTQMDYRGLSFGEKVKGFLGAPLNTFNNVQAEPLGGALKYFTIWVLIFAILRTVIFYTMERQVFQTFWNLLGLSDGTLYLFHPVTFALLAVVGAFASLFISGSLTHLFVWAFGGRKGYGNTIKAFAYGNTPLLLFGWIPFVGMLLWIWTLVLDIIGIRQLHEISMGRAVGAVLLGIVILVIIGVVIGVLVGLLAVLRAVA
jgi:hypothetical protein